jgi:hypothetical protein
MTSEVHDGEGKKPSPSLTARPLPEGPEGEVICSQLVLNSTLKSCTDSSLRGKPYFSTRCSVSNRRSQTSQMRVESPA